jgi:hypothetical protein
MSYYLDYYTSQYTEGTQLCSGWNKELNELIEGLTLIGAEKHLELFQQQSKSKINEQCKTQ